MTTASPTPAQRRAADPTRSVWVTANAGTGKTRVLSDRILRLLLAGAPPESLLAITFTKAAAAEMTARVSERLARWAAAADHALASDLEHLGLAAPGPADIERARALFAQVLELPRGLAIQTIHALCGAILRRFPLEAGVAPHFETIDDRTAAELLVEAREAVMAQARSGDEVLAKAIERLTLTLSDGSLHEALGELLAARVRLARLVGERGGLMEVIRAVEQALDVVADEEPATLIARACRIGDEDRMRLREAARALREVGGTQDGKRARLIEAWLDAPQPDRENVFREYCRAYLKADGAPVASLCTKSVAARHPDVERTLQREQARIVRVDLELRAVLAARRTGWLLTVGWAVIQAYERLKGQRAALDFDDLIERTRRLLATAEGLGWVLYKLDQRIEHVLVDEAQDTSPAQWELITRLTDEFFAGAGARARPPTLFVVGDEKQSIYRFQGADLAHLRKVHERLRARAAAAGQPLVEETLDLSFRSSRAVLELVDAVLRHPEAQRGVVDAGVAVRHDSSRAGVAGLVELWPLAVFAGGEGEAEPWPLPGTALPEDEPQRRLADAIARQVRGWIDAGEVLPATGRPLRAGDVLILLQRRGEMQELLVRALKRRDVPVAGADRLALTGHIAVRDLIALGRAMLLPEDDLNLACLLKSPLVGLDEEALLELAAGRGERSLIEQLRAAAGARPDRFAPAMARLSRWLARADFQPPFEFFVQVLGAEGGRARLLERLGREALEPIEAFLGQALAYEDGHPASLEGFLHWLELDEQELKRDPEQAADAVRVMTVHGAKGLEAPVVILADAGPHGDSRRDRLVWTADGLPLWRAAAEERPPAVAALCEAEEALDGDERRRLLYVALTRAKDRLYVAGWLGKRAAAAQATGKRAATAWHDHVRAALRSLPGVATVPFDLGYGIAGEGLRLARGAPAPVAPAEDAGDTATPPLPDWAHRAVVAEIGEQAPRAASRLGADEPGAGPASSPDGEARFRFGRHVHRLLQLVPELPAASRAAAVDRYLARQRDLDDAERRRARSSVLAVLDHPALAPAFAPGARAEQAVCGVVDGIAIAGQIDRLAVGPDRVLLVDFKTGRRGSRIPLAHLRQMAAYRALLRQIYPDRPIEAVLVWTETATVEPLESGLLDAHIPARWREGHDHPALEAPQPCP